MKVNLENKTKTVFKIGWQIESIPSLIKILKEKKNSPKNNVFSYPDYFSTKADQTFEVLQFPDHNWGSRLMPNFTGHFNANLNDITCHIKKWQF